MENNLIELEKNSVKVLFDLFDDLLLKTDIKGESNLKASEVKRIKYYTSYRIKERVLENSEIWPLILEINKLNFNSIKEIRKVHLKLARINNKKSVYLKKKNQENGFKRGLRAIKKLFD